MQQALAMCIFSFVHSCWCRKPPVRFALCCFWCRARRSRVCVPQSIHSLRWELSPHTHTHTHTRARLLLWTQNWCIFSSFFCPVKCCRHSFFLYSKRGLCLSLSLSLSSHVSHFISVIAFTHPVQGGLRAGRPRGLGVKGVQWRSSAAVCLVSVLAQPLLPSSLPRQCLVRVSCSLCCSWCVSRACGCPKHGATCPGPLRLRLRLRSQLTSRRCRAGRATSQSDPLPATGRRM